MYSYLKGKVTIVNSKGITLEVNNIGYQIIVANPYTFEIDKDYIIYIYQVVKEDELSLYGFLKLDEKAMFTDLISVTGIGPKSALAIVGAADIENLKRSIVLGDVEYLTRFPKVGKKSSSQIILDLKSKFEKEFNDVSEADLTNNSEVIEALNMLGYNEKEIKKYLKNVDNTFSTEKKIKAVLQQMTKS